MKLLLTPGYGGEVTREEIHYIKTALKASPMLRRRWGFRTSRINDQAIRKVALEGVDHAQKSPETTLIGSKHICKKGGPIKDG